MTNEVFKQLAKRLNEIPNGFPATKSGIELKLLERIFTPGEAALAARMDLDPESSEIISGRAEGDPGQVSRQLKDMVRKGLIRMKRGKGQLLFGLMPFVVGIYEEQLSRMDKELAQLFEQYYLETGGGIISEKPSVHRVIPIDKAIPFELEVFPYERAVHLLNEARSWGVRECICRKQQILIGRGCGHTLENCLMIAPVENAFKRSENTRAITKEESLKLLKKAADEGLVHSTANHREGIYYICNCCVCCCGILRGLSEFEIPAAVVASDFYSTVDESLCTGCEVCIGQCHFGALAVREDICQVDESRCTGCGLCIPSCSFEALSMERRVQNRSTTPVNLKAWMKERAQQRGI